MRICVCDTDELICNELIKNIADCFLSGEAFSVKCFYTPEEMLFHDDNTAMADAYFIKASREGLISAQIIKSKFPDAIIILTGETEEYIYEAFNLEALYYLVKPFGSDEFSGLFKRIIAKSKTLNPTLHLRWKSERYNIPIKDIIYIEGYNRHLTIYTKDGEYSSVGKIQNIYEKLCIHGFLRVHQGYTVNMEHIKQFNTDEVIMSDGTKVMISTRRKSDALKMYDSFISNKEHC